MKIKKTISIFILLIILFNILSSIVPVIAATNSEIVDAEDVKLAQSVLYAMSLLDDKMTDHEKAYILAQYVQEGNIYSMVNRHQSYKGVLIDHTAVCAGYASAYKYLMNYAGIPCETVTSKVGDHAWNVCYLDGVWTYMDTTKGISSSGTLSVATHLNGFKSKSLISGHFFKKKLLDILLA